MRVITPRAHARARGYVIGRGVYYIYIYIYFQVQPYNRKYRSIGHRDWSMSLNILTELSVN